MAREIERKFLVKDDKWLKFQKGTAYKQGYLSIEKDHTVRIRISSQNAYITIKGKTTGAARSEFEYEIPLEDGKELINMCRQPVIEKIRYKIEFKGFTWEIDKFLGKNKGLVLAEIELESEDQVFEKPDWADKEVTGDARYYNASLSVKPYSTW